MASLNASEQFRIKYRQTIASHYNPFLHIASVYVIGLSIIALCLYFLPEIRPFAWLTLPVTLVFVNFGEYALHRWLGHIKRPFAKLFYQRHSGDHHTFFIEENIPIDTVRDFRVVFFPIYLIFLFMIFPIAPLYFLLQSLGLSDAALLFVISAIGGYLLYETLHCIYHLPTKNVLTRLPGIRWLRRHHQLHHRPEFANTHNFNLIFPLFDWVLGTLKTEKS